MIWLDFLNCIIKSAGNFESNTHYIVYAHCTIQGDNERNRTGTSERASHNPRLYEPALGTPILNWTLKIIHDSQIFLHFILGLVDVQTQVTQCIRNMVCLIINDNYSKCFILTKTIFMIAVMKALSRYIYS